MPNIELFGFYPEQAKHYINEIRGELAYTPYKGDVVITRCNSTVIDLDEKKQPCLRIWTTDVSTAADIAQRLRYLNLNIEVAQLAAFIPKASDTGLEAVCHSATYYQSPAKRDLLLACHRKTVVTLGDLGEVTRSELERVGCSEGGIALANRILADYRLPALKE